MDNTNKVPELRFGGFTEDWEEKRLGEIMDVTSVKRIHQSDWSSSGVRFLRARDIVSYAKNEEPAEYLYISNEIYNEYSLISGKVKEGDLLVTGVGTIGVPFLIKNLEPIYFKDGNIIWFKNEKKINSNFFYYSFVNNRIQNYIKDSAGIGTVGTYTIESGRKTPLIFPKNDSEQKLIGNFFENIDKLITEHQQKHSKLKSLKKAMLDKMFPKEGQVVPEIRFKGFEGEWVKYNLGEISPVRGGFAFKSNEFKKGGVPILKISNILPTGEVGGNFDFYDEQPQDENFLLPNNSAVLAMSGATTGKVSILKFKENKKVYQNQRVGYFQDKNIVDYSFISILLRSPLFSNKMKAVLVAGAQPNVSPKEINAFEFYVPINSDEQQKIGSYFNNLDGLINNHDTQITKLQNIKKALLAKMFV